MRLWKHEGHICANGLKIIESGGTKRKRDGAKKP